MRQRIGKSFLDLVQGDITQQDTEVIVNAANRRLIGGGGVDGAIHRAAGPDVMQEIHRCYYSGCPPGSAVVTNGGLLVARWIIHAVGPVWKGGIDGEAAFLDGAYKTCLMLAHNLPCWSIAFPSISTGAYHYPTHLAARVALVAVIDYLRDNHKDVSCPRVVKFVLFDEQTLQTYERVLAEIIT